MLSVEQCKAILNRDAKEYTNEEVQAIRELLYQLGEIEYEAFRSGHDERKEGDHLHESVNG